MKLLIGLALVACSMVAYPIGVAAQDPPSDPPSPPDSARLVFEREIFVYPSYERRNPFLSLSSSGEGGPWFEDLRLMAVIYSEEPGRSVALIGAGPDGPEPATPEEPTSSRTRRLRVGDTWGNTTVVEIQRRSVLVEVIEFGLTERHVLDLPRPGVGGS